MFGNENLRNDIKETLIEQVKEYYELSEDIDFEALTDDFIDYCEIDYWDWVSGNLDSFHEDLDLDKYKKEAN